MLITWEVRSAVQGSVDMVQKSINGTFAQYVTTAAKYLIKVSPLLARLSYLATLTDSPLSPDPRQHVARWGGDDAVHAPFCRPRTLQSRSERFGSPLRRTLGCGRAWKVCRPTCAGTRRIVIPWTVR